MAALIQPEIPEFRHRSCETDSAEFQLQVVLDAPLTLWILQPYRLVLTRSLDKLLSRKLPPASHPGDSQRSAWL